MNTRSPFEPDRHGCPVPVVVRAARVEDADAIAPIDVERGVGTLEELVPRIERALESLRALDARAYSCVALVDDRIVGYGKCAYQEWPTAVEGPPLPSGWFLTGVEVARAQRRQGVGRALTRHRLGWLHARTDVAYYLTGEQNYPSQSLHRELGFVDVRSGVVIPRSGPIVDDELHILGVHSRLVAFAGES